MTLNQALGRTAKEARGARRLTLVEMGAKVGCASDTVYAFEIGRFESWRLVREFAQALGMTPGGFVSLAESLQPRYEESDRTAAELRMEITSAMGDKAA